MAKKTAEAERRTEELRRQEEEEQKRLKEQAEKERLAALEREQYMTMKEARLAAEREVRQSSLSFVHLPICVGLSSPPFLNLF